MAASLLVRTAVYGRDPNWGRIMMAVGKTGIPLVESKIDIFVNGIQIVHEGKAIAYNVQSVIAALDQPEVELRVDLNCGDGFGEAWGCDLTEVVRSVQLGVHDVMSSVMADLACIVVKIGGSTLGEGDSTIDDVVELWSRGYSPCRGTRRGQDDLGVGFSPGGEIAVRARVAGYGRRRLWRLR